MERGSSSDATSGPGEAEVEFMVAGIEEAQPPSQRNLAPFRSTIRIEGSEICAGRGLTRQA
jgi:hypothetical protein